MFMLLKRLVARGKYTVQVFVFYNNVFCCYNSGDYRNDEKEI